MTSSNILKVYKQSTDQDKSDGISWYRDALEFCETIALDYGMSVYVVAGVVTALSPRNKWDRNKQDALALIKAHANNDSIDDVKVCTFSANKNKAVTIIKTCSAMDQVVYTLKGPKMIEFFNCIVGVVDVCIDGHAFAIWEGERITLANVPSIGVKLRRVIKADYIKAAKKVKITPSELQAVTWCAWRRIHEVV